MRRTCKARVVLVAVEPGRDALARMMPELPEPGQPASCSGSVRTRFTTSLFNACT